MTINELDKKLNQANLELSEEIRAIYSETSKVPANEGDINECAKQVFYTLEKFRKSIIEYLQSNQS